MIKKKYPINPNLPITVRGRLTAVQSFMQSLQSGGGMGKAIKIFNEAWNENKHVPISARIGDPADFVPNQLKKLFRDGAMKRLAPQQTHHKMPDSQVKVAGDILAAGYPLPCWGIVGGRFATWNEQRHFTSIAQAMGVSQQLADLMDEYDVTARYLLDRMKHVCPDLVYSVLPIKRELSPAQRLARQQWAQFMLDQLAADPLWLHKIIWGDETRIYVGKDLQGKLKVWHYRGDVEGHSPEECQMLDKNNMIRLDLLMFVNAELGCCHVEFLTGTTGIEAQGRYTAGMAAVMALRRAAGLGGYKVSRGS